MILARVVIVDDSLLIRRLLRGILSEAGHQVVGEAADGLRAPQLVREVHPDLITLDLVMPGRGGLATLQHVLALDPGLAVVVCSASLTEHRVLEALRCGATGFIVKPLDRRRVLDAVNAAPGRNSRQLERLREEPDDRHTDSAHCPPTTVIGPGADSAGTVERLHRLCRDLARELRDILETAVDAHRVTLEQILALEYQPLRGALVPQLGRLFDIARVPVHGFDPPKFQTAYDAIVDRAMMQRMDAVLADEPGLTFALGLDLNAYAPAHNTAFSRGWTGEPRRDLETNRTKRFFLDSPALIRAARMHLGIDAPARRLSRSELEAAGGRLHEPANAGESFLLVAYTRDTGAVLNTLSVPLYVKRQRWGVVTLGWDPDILPG